MEKVIIHISEVDIGLEGGMGRVEYYWKRAFEEVGFNFIHIGPKEIGKIKHKGLFPYKAFAYYKKLDVIAKAIIVHEPLSGPFANLRIPTFLESHGIERRYWENQLSSNFVKKISYKTKLLYPIWRLHNADKGIKKFHKLLLINEEDKDYVIKKYKRSAEDILVFKNGIFLTNNSRKDAPKVFTIVFNGSWIDRKGKIILIEAASQLLSKGFILKYLLIGTQVEVNQVLSDWPPLLHNSVEVISQFNHTEEIALLDRANVFVLPSYYEGQPLSLLQAMERGMCCISTNCCGQKDFIIHRTNGLLFNSGDSNGLYELIKECIQYPEFCENIGANAKKISKERLWSKAASEVRQFIVENS